MRKVLRKLHRWIGVSASLWLLVLATTGLLLQHSQSWQLDKSFITNTYLLKKYGIGKHLIIFENNTSTITQIDENIIINGHLKHFSEKIQQASFQKPYWIIQTQSEYNWINEQGQTVQTLDILDKSQTQNIKWLKPTTNNKLKQQAIKQSSKNYLSIEKFIFDIHAGITSPSIINDISAIALIILSLSGIILFIKPKKRLI